MGRRHQVGQRGRVVPLRSGLPKHFVMRGLVVVAARSRRFDAVAAIVVGLIIFFLDDVVFGLHGGVFHLKVEAICAHFVVAAVSGVSAIPAFSVRLFH